MPQFTWNVSSDVRQLFAFAFMVNAFEAGTIAALMSAVIGWFVVLRREAFAAHTLAVIGFPGASGAALLGLPATLGYFVLTGVGAIAMIPVSRGGRGRESAETATVGTIQGCALALGYLFVTLGHSNLAAAQTLLFGSFLGITTSQVELLVFIGVLVLLAIGWIARPLLFTSLDPDVAAARGVPTRALSAAFILLLGAAVAEASQITGSLLVFALLVVPAATACRITARPGLSVLAAIAIAIAVTWAGLTTSYYADYPIGFTVTTYAFAMYIIVRSSARTTLAPSRARRRV